jgi:hypothetical protein
MQAQPDVPPPPAVPSKSTPRPQPSPAVITPSRAAQPVAGASASKCDALTEQLGRVFDKMDQARSKAHMQEQMDKWNQEVKELERKKQQSGCF